MKVQVISLVVAAILGLSHATSVLRVDANDVVEEIKEAKPVNLTAYYD